MQGSGVPRVWWAGRVCDHHLVSGARPVRSERCTPECRRRWRWWRGCRPDDGEGDGLGSRQRRAVRWDLLRRARRWPVAARCIGGCRHVSVNPDECSCGASSVRFASRCASQPPAVKQQNCSRRRTLSEDSRSRRHGAGGGHEGAQWRCPLEVPERFVPRGCWTRE